MKNNPESDPRTYAIIGAAMEVHTQLGCGFLEPIYQEALALKFANREIVFRDEKKFPVSYKGTILKSYYRPDFICFDSIVVELKALNRLPSVEESQVINYLKVTGLHTGLLLNFGARSLNNADSFCLSLRTSIGQLQVVQIPGSWSGRAPSASLLICVICVICGC